MWTDVHAHTAFSDGSELDSMVAAADAAGLDGLGLADHCIVVDDDFGRREQYDLVETFERRRERIEAVRTRTDLELYADDRVALVGANGAGKSTLLRLITGLESPHEGTVTVLGQDTSETLPETLADDTVYIHQTPEEMFVEDNVRKDIAYYLRNRGADRVDERVEEILTYLDLEHLAERDGRLMSLGQQRRASLGIGLATDPTVVLLDEPTGSLDLQSRREVTGMLRKAESRVETVVVASHDLQLVAAWADRVIVMGDGDVLADAPPGAVFADSGLLAETGLGRPQVVELGDRLGFDDPVLTADAMVEALSGADPEGALVETTADGELVEER